MRHEMRAGWSETEALIEAAMRGGRSAPVRPAAAERTEVVMVSDYLVERWESTYDAYRAASESVDASIPGDSVAAEQMAKASHAVATAWRDIAVESDLSWWSAAAVTTAGRRLTSRSRTGQRARSMDAQVPAMVGGGGRRTQSR